MAEEAPADVVKALRAMTQGQNATNAPPGEW